MSDFEIRPLQAGDRAGWEPLARGYKQFYETELDDAGYERAWQKLLAGQEAHGLVLLQGGRVIGLAHYLMHASTWSDRVCYLQDLFVAEDARGQGAAAALIEAVAAVARGRGAARYYWLTHHTNARARRLYDRVGQHGGFLRYDYKL
ncbi:GNAT family N-acetyltransferase [Pelomonas sp. V22]|uniref:GNAT family N-acetyltransferase n=1 Tax=Pelomonas sp. V22 TaxID=2822139 RepID=UPI0024A8811A|nr:GNAT family N-acetyltransferase [Pelomonas sp. V22]MDI4632009.1 GNAT family N-acetyltransferase [Pelomonas sp. V22]